MSEILTKIRQMAEKAGKNLNLKNLKTHHHVLFVALIAVAVGFSTNLIPTLNLNAQQNGAQSTGNVHGAMWDANFGWTNTNCQDDPGNCSVVYHMIMDPVTGVITGGAWNPNLQDYMAFDSTYTTGCPGGGNCQARVTDPQNGGAVAGW